MEPVARPCTLPVSMNSRYRLDPEHSDTQLTSFATFMKMSFLGLNSFMPTSSPTTQKPEASPGAYLAIEPQSG